jgi:hypothetical protein
MSLPSFFRSFTHVPERRDYNFDPARLSLFDSRRMTAPCDQDHEPHPYRLHVVPRLAVCQRTEYLSVPSAEIPSLVVDAANHTIVSVVGTDADEYDVRFHAQAGAANEDKARRLLGAVLFTHTGTTFTVTTPRHRPPARAWLNFDAPRHRPLTVNGNYSYVEAFGIDGPVNVSTNHARVKLLEVAGEVKATALGVIDYSGDHGQIQLDATGEIGEINLRLSSSRFKGTLDANADNAVRVLLPQGWESPFEAVVYRPDLFLCRANIRPSVHLSDREGLALFTYGRGDPTLRLVSQGVIVIDSIGRIRSCRA